MGFNSRKGIELALFDYFPFVTVMRERHDDAHRVGNVLDTFVVLGRFETDSRGQLTRLNREVFTDADRAAMPPVMTKDEFIAWVAVNIAPRHANGEFVALYEGTFGVEPSFPLPPAHVLCARCGKGWEIATCHEIGSDTTIEHVSLEPYVGTKLRDALFYIAQQADASRESAGPLAVRNARWETPTDGTDNPSRDPEQRGWRSADSTDVAISPNYVIAPGDSTGVFATRYYHGPCFKELAVENDAECRVQSAEGLAGMFSESGFEDVRVSTVPIPEYLRAWLAKDIGDQAAQVPYFRVDTRQGSLGIWTAVYPVIDLHGTGILPKDLGIETDPDDTTLLPCVPFLADETQLLRLWQLMTKRQRDTPAAS